MKSENSEASAIPRRLIKDPILEAICEVRFESAGNNIGALMPGLLYERLKGGYPVFEKLPIADFAAVIRDSDPNFRFAPQYRLRGDAGIIQLGERVLSVAVVDNYPGWSIFREHVRAAWSAAMATGLISGVSRISVKYVNLLSVPAGSGVSDVTTARVNLGGEGIDVQPIDLRTELRNGDHVTVIRVANPANVNTSAGESKSGLVLDVDTVRMSPIISSFEELMPYFELAHAEEKRVFYSLLSKSTLISCEPDYE